MEVFDSTNEERAEVSSQHIHKITVLIVIFIVSFIFTISLLITVLLTKAVRTQMVGTLLINMALAVMLFGVIGIPVMVREELDYPDMETFSCRTIYIFLYVPTLTFNASLVFLGVDSIFELPNSVRFRLGLLTVMWSFAFTFALAEVYGVGNGYTHDAPVLCTLSQTRSNIVELTIEFAYVYLPLLCILIIIIVIVVKYLKNHNSNKTVNLGEARPFVISAILFITLVSPLRILHYFRAGREKELFPVDLSEFFSWIMIVYLVVRPVICIIWIFTLPALRGTICRKGSSPDEDTYLLTRR